MKRTSLTQCYPYAANTRGRDMTFPFHHPFIKHVLVRGVRQIILHKLWHPSAGCIQITHTPPLRCHKSGQHHPSTSSEPFASWRASRRENSCPVAAPRYCAMRSFFPLTTHSPAVSIPRDEHRSCSSRPMTIASNCTAVKSQRKTKSSCTLSVHSVRMKGS